MKSNQSTQGNLIKCSKSGLQMMGTSDSQLLSDSRKTKSPNWPIAVEIRTNCFPLITLYGI